MMLIISNLTEFTISLDNPNMLTWLSILSTTLGNTSVLTYLTNTFQFLLYSSGLFLAK